MTEIFLDSGAYTLFTRSLNYQEENNCGRWDFYDSKEFWSYMKKYISFIKHFQKELRYYANLDAIGNAELSWRNQQHMEKQGLSPVPIVHRGTNLDWINHYIESGYEFIALGGLVGGLSGAKWSKIAMRQWLDDCFTIICSTQDCIPCVKTHGFGVTSYSLLIRYPWFSVDSTTWIKRGNYGEILVPCRKKDKFIFTELPHTVPVSTEHSSFRKGGKHYVALTKASQGIVQDWLQLIDVPLGKSKGEEVLEEGVINNAYQRWVANLSFFMRMKDAMPPYPWAWQPRKSKLGLV